MKEEISPKNIVLYADDDLDDIHLVKEAFFTYSPHVQLITVKDGIEAISYLKNLSGNDSKPCLIILDINMPKMDGKETLVAIRALQGFQEIPVTLFTTSSQRADKDFANKFNAGFLTKPIDSTQMEIIATTFIQHCSGQIKKNINPLTE